MRKIIAALLLSLAAIAAPFAVSPWTAVAEKLQNSIVFLQGENMAGCTGFVIDAERKHVLTAAHCDAEKNLTVDSMITVKLFKDERKDLMVLRVTDLSKPALKLATSEPERGDEVASMGYGFAQENPLFRIAHVSNVRMELDGLSGPFMVIDSDYIGGQSGGPLVNINGDVVGIVQRGASGFGAGVDSRTIKDRAGRYFAN